MAESWEHLLQELFAGAWQESLKRHRLRTAFRGQSDASAPLLTPLGRMGPDAWRVEGSMLRAFCKYARNVAERHDSMWDWLAVARHHGLPTRLLDWTYSPFVALHFATADHPERDGVVWCVNYAETNRRLPAKLRRVLQREEADVFTAEMLDKAAASLHALDKLSKRPFALFFEPPSLDGRIVNQFALFSVISPPLTCLDGWLEENSDASRRIRIPAKLKTEVRDMLDQSNITERVLFPGLDGLSRYLQRYYQPRS